MPLVALTIASAALVAALVSGRPEIAQREEQASVHLDLTDPVWQSLESAAPLGLTGRGSYWLAFRAFSVGLPTRVRITGPAGGALTVGVSTAPRTYATGPVRLDGLEWYRLEPRLSSTARRSPAGGSLFVSSFRLTRRPVAALPGRGFWENESWRGGSADANWLKSRGRIELVSADPALRRAWIAFDATSIDRERTLAVTGGGVDQRLSAPERGSRRRLVVGPIDLRDGRAELELSSPDPASYGSDSRLRTILVSDLEAYGARPGS